MALARPAWVGGVYAASNKFPRIFNGLLMFSDDLKPIGYEHQKKKDNKNNTLSPLCFWAR